MIVLFLIFSLFVGVLQADGFIISNGETVTSTQTLTTPGATGIVEEGGTINVSGSTGVVMETGSDQVLQNFGTIESDILAITSSGVGAYITNSGTIQAQEDIVIEITGNNSFLLNTGTIVGPYYVIITAAENSVIINEGTITAGQYCITSSKINSQIINQGLLNGNYGMFIINEGNNSLVINKNTISTVFTAMADLTTNGSIMINQGNISIVGNDGTGMGSTSSQSQMANYGTISLLIPGVPGSVGISTSGNDVIVTNGGLIQAFGSIAIFLSGTNNSLVLMRGSNIQGEVITSYPAALYVENGLNLALTLSPIYYSSVFEEFFIEDPYAVSDDGSVVAVIDPTSIALQADVAADLSDSLLDGIAPHRGPLICGRWVEVVANYRKRKARNHLMSYRDVVGGLVVGFDGSVREGRLSLFGELSLGKAEVMQNTARADILLAGLGTTYGRMFFERFYGDFTAFGGYLRWNNRREVANNMVPNGLENAYAYINGAFATAEIAFSETFSYLTITENFRYAGLFLGDYQENGSLADLAIFHRNVNLLTLRLEAALGNMGCSFRKAQPYAGLYGRYQLTGNFVEAVLLDNELTFAEGGPRTLTALLLGLRGKIVKLFYNIEYNIDSRDSYRLLGELKYGF